MTDSSQKASDSSRPLLLLPALGGACAAALAATEILAPGSNPIHWTWWLYGIGGVVIFILLFRKKKGGDLAPPPAKHDMELQETEGSAKSLDDVRSSIRNRKRDKREKK